MARILMQLTPDAVLTDFALEVTSGLLRTTRRLSYDEVTAVTVQETWLRATLIIRGKENESNFRITTSKETAAKARSIIHSQVQAWQRLASQTAAYPELEPYRRFVFALLKCRYAQIALGDDFVGALDPFGIFRSKGQEGRHDDKVAEANAIVSVKTLLARIAKHESWSPDEITRHISSLKQLQAAEFSKEPWVFHKREPYQLLPGALDALHTFERRVRGFSIHEVNAEIADVVLDAADFGDMRVRAEALINKYLGNPRAGQAIRDSMAFELEILEQVARAALEDLDRKCPECAERPKAEARVCRYCGYRFEGETADQDLEEARLKAERIAIAAARELAGVGPKAKAAVEEVAVKAAALVIEALRKAQAGTI